MGTLLAQQRCFSIDFLEYSKIKRIQSNLKFNIDDVVKLLVIDIIGFNNDNLDNEEAKTLFDYLINCV